MLRKGMARVLAAAVLLLAAPALAQEAEAEDDEARVHFRLGRAYYDSGRFEDAAREFETAYELSQRPQLLYNVFIAYRDAAQLGPAISALERYLELVPDGPERDSLEARLASMRRLHEQQQAARAASTDRREPEPEPTDAGEEPTGPEPDDPEPGPDRGGTPDEGAQSGGAPPPAEMPPDGGGGSLVPWIVMGAGGALLVGGAITGVMALGAEGDLEEMCPMDACPPGFEDTRDRGQTLATVTDVLLVTGFLTGAAGAALLFLLDNSAPIEQDPTVSASCGPGGCAGSVRLRF